MIAPILMIVIGLIFLAMFMFKYMTIQDEIMYEDKEQANKIIKVFMKNTLPYVIMWALIVLIGLLILSFKLYVQ